MKIALEWRTLRSPNLQSCRLTASSAMPKLHFFTHVDNQAPKADKEPRKPKLPKDKYRLTNWSDYNKTLINRGFITLWLDEDTLANWYFQGPRARGGLVRYSDQCLQAALALKAVFGLAFRQTQGLIQSLLLVMKMDLQVPSYSQLCRRQASLSGFSPPPPSRPASVEGLHMVVDSTGLKVYGEGEWKVKKHGADKRRMWRKLHLAADEATTEIYAVELTTNAVSDGNMAGPLLAAIEQPVSKFGGDGAYDQVKVYDYLQSRQIQPLIPPRVNAVIWTDGAGNALIHPRNEVIRQAKVVGLSEWKRQSGYHRRSKVETVMFRWKTTFGEGLSARLLTHQQTEARVKANCLNRLAKLGMPKTVRCAPT